MRANSGVRVDCRKVYTARHLKRYYPEAFGRALDHYREDIAEDATTIGEIVDSLRGLFRAAGVSMNDWEIGAYSYSHLRAGFPGYSGAGDASELRGGRAQAWIENNLLGQFRAPFGLPKLKAGTALPEGFTRGWIAPCKKYPRGAVTASDNNPVTRWTRPGARRECPFTGVCWDEDLIDALLKAIREGDTLREVFEGLADEAQRLIEAADEDARSESSFLDAAEANGWEYTRNGEAI